MKLTGDQVKKVAKLASLPLSEEEVDENSVQLSKILDYIDQLEKVDTKDVEPNFNVTELANVMREDEIFKSLTSEDALKNASQAKDGFFVTKGVFESE